MHLIWNNVIETESKKEILCTGTYLQNCESKRKVYKDLFGMVKGKNSEDEKIKATLHD